MPATSTQTLARTVIYAALIIVTAGLTVAMLLLWQNIAERKEEARQLHFRLVELTEDIVDPAEWGKNFPRQYDGYRRTVEDTRHGGSEAPPSRLEKDPLLKLIYAGHPFAVDFREARGHAYMLRDQDVSERTKRFPQPGSCLHCHSTPLQAYRQHGRQAGIGDDRPWEQLIKGFEILSTMPYERARAFVSHPVACVDCHEPRTAQLRVTRPAFLIGIRQLARSQAPVPHLPSIAKWRQEHQAHLQSVPLGKYFIFDAQHAKNSLKQKGQIEYQHADNNPFVTAFVCPNPLTKQGTAAPVRTAAADSDTDTHQLNQSELYSLLRCNKPWTLVVKVYPRTGMLGNEKPSVLAPEGLFRSAFGPKPGVKERDATELARQLATALRRPDKGLDAYVYHTRNSSMVTVGGFNSPSDPELMKYQRLLSGMKLLVQGETIELMAQPTPMPVPRTR